MKSRIDRGMRPWLLAIASTSILVVLGAGPSASSALTFRGVATHAAGLRAAGPRAREGVARMATWTGMSWGQSRGSVTLDGSPGVPIANPKTRTLYVPIQCGDPSSNDSCDATADDVIDVINAGKCRPGSDTGCSVVARATVGSEPIAATVDPSTDTIYTANATGTVSVVNGARCNARVTDGCDKPVATIQVGGFLVYAALDPLTHTLYVADPNGHVFVLNVAACNAVSATGCNDPVRTINDPRGPDWVDVDLATDTVYVADDGTNENGDTVSVFNGATCNGTDGNGCGQSGHKIHSGPNPFDLVVDQGTDTVYVANTSFNNGSVAVINGATCNAKVKSGCGQSPAQVPTGSDPTFLALDGSLHTLFAINDTDETISEFDTRFCNGTVTSGCSARPHNETATFNPPESGGTPNTFALDPETGTVFVVNVGGQSFLQAESIRHCNAVDSSGCRLEAPSASNPEFLTVVDQTTNTIYAGNSFLPQIDVLNAKTCRAGDVSGCAPVAEIPVGYSQANMRTGAIDEATHTLYSADFFGNYISVINIAHCTATDTAGCSATWPQLTVGPNPGPPVLNPKTGTLYAPYEGEGAANKVAVMDATTSTLRSPRDATRSLHRSRSRTARSCSLSVFGTTPSTGRGSVLRERSPSSTAPPATRPITRGAITLLPSSPPDSSPTTSAWMTTPTPSTCRTGMTATSLGPCPSSTARPATAETCPVAARRRPRQPWASDRLTSRSTTGPASFTSPISSVPRCRRSTDLTATPRRPRAAPTRYGSSRSDHSPNVVAVNDRTNTVYSMNNYGPDSMSVFAGAPGGNANGVQYVNAAARCRYQGLSSRARHDARSPRLPGAEGISALAQLDVASLCRSVSRVLRRCWIARQHRPDIRALAY